ncbi:NAD(P)/FAD-dependent oxidoreductase [Nocardia uniformis]|uniref:NAD(P)/FAD-dependent oxidoreductase n=1 Tax=Nocardia uniformis TaxID=53432 RepID=A0A849C034_9NOCA|nr:NAD(P)/FAD-dependent oxidoreductase [Nocardia uniformis]NNH70958.1 NAD(P)/FAD-dependent oxidoreductase [Nocardia uniformis]
MSSTAVAETAPLTRPDHEVVIIGAGFGGIATGVALKQAGVEDFVIFDKHSGIGGTWWANRYPGIAVDIPAVYYSLSYMPFRTSTRVFPPGHEVQEYTEQIVDEYGLRPHITLNTRVSGAIWDERTHLWTVRFDDRTVTCRFLCPALGYLEVPKLPDIPGIDRFAGKAVHTADWDHDFDYAGKRIGVIGTGATALQLIPELADIAEHLTVFQRTPIWLAPKPDFRVDWGLDQFLQRNDRTRKVVRGAVAAGIDLGLVGLALSMRRLPRVAPALTAGARGAYRMWLRDKELYDKLAPTYAPGCKRPSLSSRYMKTFKNRDRTSLITEGIERVTEKGVVTADGVEHPIDVLVCATGFRVCERGFSPAFEMIGAEGKELGDYWHETRYHAYQGVTVPGWPNMFMVACGPNSVILGSILTTVENTAAKARRLIVEARRRGATRVDVTPEAYREYADKCLEKMEGSLWVTAPCAGSNTYYVNYQGDLAVRPSTNIGQWLGTRHFPWRAYQFGKLAPGPQPAAPVKKAVAKKTAAKKPAAVKAPAKKTAAKPPAAQQIPAQPLAADNPTQ